MTKMNSPWKTDQKKYVSKRVPLLLTEIRLIINDDIYTIPYSTYSLDV